MIPAKPFDATDSSKNGGLVPRLITPQGEAAEGPPDDRFGGVDTGPVWLGWAGDGMSAPGRRGSVRSLPHPDSDGSKSDVRLE